ncbi:MAG: phosphate/phosphite/phosphonate ABC transporter binding protein [Candidatus Electronema aureum]|uniref:Phosphate/phosphite/phosphonate ABC transporter binding protein n=1 Tax=Candidatus Electronema aureum TaxID=2005002 RepID=A0A521G1U0_9BACT|nr:MAG: phosphate/phosphite/phosphonate ABC transporter binding protein [Candidatus Electronema aureum]
MIRRNRLLLATAMLAAFVLLQTFQAAAEEYTIGVLAKNGASEVITQWNGHGEYLSKATGISFSVMPVTFLAMDAAIKEKKIDFILANPAIVAEMGEKYGVKAVATMINKIKNKSVHQFGGVIFVRKDSLIEKLEDIKGKKFGFVKKSSFGGLHAGLYLLKTNGIDPEKDCLGYAEIGTHEQVVHAVADKLVDVGTVRTDTLERMAEDGKINMDDFRIINKVEDDFPFVHSTVLYPEWPLAALAHVKTDVSKKVSSALIDMKENSSAAQGAKISGWKQAVDYAPVLECLRTIGMKAGE